MLTAIRCVGRGSRGSRVRRRAATGSSLSLAGGGLLIATLGKTAGYDWPELGANQGAAELLVVGAAVLLAGWLVRALSTREEPVAAVSALAGAVALVSAMVAIDQLIERDRAAGAALLVVAGAFAVRRRSLNGSRACATLRRRCGCRA